MRKYRAYIAKKPCGCIFMAVVDNPEHRRDTAKEVAKSIRRGGIIERVTTDYVTKHWLCPKHQTEATSKEVLDRLADKTTPQSCRFSKCRYNSIPPGIGSQECVGCEGLITRHEAKFGKRR